MEIPLQITSRNFSLSEAIESAIREKAAKLDNFHDRITSCRVLVEAPHRHKHQGVLYNIRVDITIPGSELVVKREPNEDIYVAIRDTFDAATRQLKEKVRKQRGEVKFHEHSPHGRVSEFFPDKNYGFISTPDGREIYFHSNSVKHNHIDILIPGTEVKFIEEQGDKGPQASFVAPVS